MRYKTLLAAFLLLFPGCALAQVATQQTATHLDAAQALATINTTAGVLTLTPQTGSVYISNIHISNCAGASAVTAAAQTSITSTNLNGLTYQMGSGTSAGLCVQEIADNFGPGGYKAAAPGAVTITLPTFKTNQTISIWVAWWSAP